MRMVSRSAALRSYNAVLRRSRQARVPVPVALRGDERRTRRVGRGRKTVLVLPVTDEGRMKVRVVWRDVLGAVYDPRD